MTAIDFVRDGMIGDKVHDMRRGNGVIRGINPSMTYGVTCAIDGDLISYTQIGKVWYGDKIASLCWGHRATIDQGQPPERFNYPLYMEAKATGTIVEFTGLQTDTLLNACKESVRVGTTLNPIWKSEKPMWCYVNGSSRVRLIYQKNSLGRYVDSQGCHWIKAEPCATKDVPDWWPKEWV